MRALFHFLLLVITGSSCNLDQQRAGLEALYYSTDGENWAKSGNWTLDLPVGSWYGVETDSGGCVLSIDLRDNGLIGPVPLELDQLHESLVELDLSENDITGPIPDPISNLSKLISLLIEDTSLTGTIPTSLSKLQLLEDLALGANDLTGPIPTELGAIKSLVNLGLSENRLTGTIPRSISELPQLEILDLEDNDLSGTLPAYLGNLTTLLEIYIGYNDFYGKVPAELSRLQSLKVLSINFCKFSEQLPDELADMASLESLYMINNSIPGTVPAAFGRFPSLKIFLANNNDFTGTIPPELSNISPLQELVLGYNPKLSGTIPKELGRLQSLTYLGLNGNNVSGTIPPELGNCTALQKLYLVESLLHGTIPPELGRLQNMQELLLYTNHLTGTIPAEIGNLPNLVHLGLSGNMLTGTVPSLRGCSNLNRLTVARNNLVGDILQVINEIPSLKTLNASDNRFSSADDAPVILAHPNLTVCLLARNHYNARIQQLTFAKGDGFVYADLTANPWICPYPKREGGDGVVVKDLCIPDWRIVIWLGLAGLIGGIAWALIRYVFHQYKDVLFVMVYLQKQVVLGVNISFLFTTLHAVQPVPNTSCGKINIYQLFSRLVPVIIAPLDPPNSTFRQFLDRVRSYGWSDVEEADTIAFRTLCNTVGSTQHNCYYDSNKDACLFNGDASVPYSTEFTALVYGTLASILLQEVIRVVLVYSAYRGADLSPLRYHYATRSFLAPLLLFKAGMKSFKRRMGEKTRTTCSKVIFIFITNGWLVTFPLLVIGIWYATWLEQTGLSNLQMLAIILNALSVFVPVLQRMRCKCCLRSLPPDEIEVDTTKDYINEDDRGSDLSSAFLRNQSL